MVYPLTCKSKSSTRNYGDAAQRLEIGQQFDFLALVGPNLLQSKSVEYHDMSPNRSHPEQNPYVARLPQQELNKPSLKLWTSLEMEVKCNNTWSLSNYHEARGN